MVEQTTETTHRKRLKLSQVTEGNVTKTVAQKTEVGKNRVSLRAISQTGDSRVVHVVAVAVAVVAAVARARQARLCDV